MEGKPIVTSLFSFLCHDATGIFKAANVRKNFNTVLITDFVLTMD